MAKNKTMTWLNNIPSRINEDGRLQLLPAENGKPEKSPKEIAPAFKKAAEYMIKNKFPGILS
jgi:hypothetical protein